MKKFEVEVKIRFKEGILDPQAEAIQSALKRLQFKNIQSVELEKAVLVYIEADNETAALDQGRKMAKDLLANTVMENFEVSVHS